MVFCLAGGFSPYQMVVGQICRLRRTPGFPEIRPAMGAAHDAAGSGPGGDSEKQSEEPVGAQLECANNNLSVRP